MESSSGNGIVPSTVTDNDDYDYADAAAEAVAIIAYNAIIKYSVLW